MKGTRIRLPRLGDGIVQGIEDDVIVLGLSGGRVIRIQLEELGPISILEVPAPTSKPAVRLDSVRRVTQGTSLDGEALLHWAVSVAPNVSAPASFSHPSMCLGDGPLTDLQMLTLLNEVGGRHESNVHQVEVLVLGHSEWAPAVIHDLLRARSGQSLRVYSQEMFLAMIATQADPLDSTNHDLVLQMGLGHNGLKFLEHVEAFRWPSADVPTGLYSGALDLDAESVGYLKFEGYQVGTSRRDATRRQSILQYCYLSGTVPHFYAQWYRDDWGEPTSAKRLQKMANSIAAFARLAQQRDRTGTSIAVEHWVEDLSFLKETFYDGQHVFSWPKTQVW